MRIAVVQCQFDQVLSQNFSDRGIICNFKWLDEPMISFKGTHFPKDIILYAVFFYVRYGVSYRDLEEIMAERGVKVDHATLKLGYRLFAAHRSRSQKT